MFKQNPVIFLIHTDGMRGHPSLPRIIMEEPVEKVDLAQAVPLGIQLEQILPDPVFPSVERELPVEGRPRVPVRNV